MAPFCKILSSRKPRDAVFISRAANALATILFALVTVLSLPADRAEAQSKPEVAGTAGSETITGLAVSGPYIYAAGWTTGALDGPNLGGSDIFIRKYGEDGDMIWGRQFGTNVTDNADIGSGTSVAVASDSAGNVYVMSSTLGSLAGSRGSLDTILRKYNKNGQVLWTRQLGTAGEDYNGAVAVDPTGNIYVVGTTNGSLQGASKGSWDAFVRKYNPNGAVLWTRQFGTSTDDFASAVATDDDGNVFVSGTTLGALGGPAIGSYDPYVRKYSPDGAVLWTKHFGTPAYDAVTGLATDSAGGVIVIGYTAGALPGFANAGDTDGFVRRYSKNGAVLFTDQFGTAQAETVYGVAIDPTNNFYLTGYTTGALSGANAGLHDVFVRKYTTANAVAWTRQFGTAGADVGRALAAATAAKVYVAGSTTGTLVGANQGMSDAFLRRLNQNGVAIWTDQ